jgi:hypothetical protein
MLSHVGRNPYIIDRPLSEQDLFHGREHELSQLTGYLKTGQRLVLLFGRRYIGKTSFLNQLTVRLGAEYAVRRVELDPLDQGQDLLWMLLERVLQALGAAPPIEESYRADPAGYVVQSLRDLAPATADVTLFCLDALPLSALSPDSGAQWQTLATALGQTDRLAMVLAIEGHPAELGAAISVPDIPQITLGPLSQEETEDLLAVPVRGVLAFDYESLRRIHHLCGGQPFSTQLFGHTLFVERASVGWVGLPEVEHASRKLLNLESPQFEALWASVPPLEKIALAAFAAMKNTAGLGSSTEVVAHLASAGVHIPLADVRAALDDLAAREILDRLGGLNLRFGSELLRLWIRQNKPVLETAREARKLRQMRLIRPSPARERRIDWAGMAMWALAVLLALAVASVWRSRERDITWSAATPAPSAAASAVANPTMPLPTPDTGLAPGRIVYMAREGDDARLAIYIMRGDGSDPVRLTTAEGNDTLPALSPDGRRIVFVSDRDGNREIYVMNADGSGQLNLTRHAAEDWTPCWSPDGQHIAFASLRDGNWEIYVMNADGSQVQRLTDHRSTDYGPAWSPDGSSIAFVSERDGNLEIYVMAADGSNVRRVTRHDSTDQAPAWSPDSTRLAWASYRDGNMEIYMASPDGNDVVNITRDSTADDHGPTWAPGGRYIAYYSNREGNWDIYSLDLETGRRVNLTLSAVHEQAPHWGR